MPAKPLQVTEITWSGERIAMRVEVPGNVDFQYIYRAARCVYWNPEQEWFEARTTSRVSALEGFQLIYLALEEEYGMHLVPSARLAWPDLGPADRSAIETYWGGRGH